jgi:hypothetical protein
MWVAVISENARSLDFARDDNFTGVGGTAEAVPFPKPGAGSNLAVVVALGSKGTRNRTQIEQPR